MRKFSLRSKIFFVFLMVAAILFIVSYSKNSLALYNVKAGEYIGLNVEKVDKDTIKISLDEFEALPKSIQLSLEIEGDAIFKEDTVKWLATSVSGNLRNNIKVSENKKKIQLFIVGNEPLNKESAKLELLEIKVAKDNNEQAIFKVVPSINENGISYSYIDSNNNKQIKGTNLANIDDSNLTINMAPSLKLKKISSVIEGKIVLTKGDTFDPLEYVEAFDEEDGKITNVTVQHDVKTDTVGSYNITYKAIDSIGDEGTLTTTVIVEEVPQVINKPFISVLNTIINTNTGQSVDLLEGVSATDYFGRKIEVIVSGDYDINTSGKYTIKYNAVDRFGNKADEVQAILNVNIPLTPLEPSKPIEPENPGGEGSGGETTPGEPENPGGEGSGGETTPGEPENPGGEGSGGETTPGEPENPGGEGSGGETTPGEPENPGGEGSGGETTPGEPENPGGEGSGGETIPGEPENPGEEGSGGETTPGEPENPGEEGSEGETTPEKAEENDSLIKDEIKQTGQGIYFGVIIIIAMVLISGGIYMTIKKKN